MQQRLRALLVVCVALAFLAASVQKAAAASVDEAISQCHLRRSGPLPTLAEQLSLGEKQKQPYQGVLLLLSDEISRLNRGAAIESPHSETETPKGAAYDRTAIS
jgi:hypothetical protein